MDNIKRYVACLICLLVVASCLCIRLRAAEPEPTARAAILIDASTGRVIYEKNSDAQLQMASTTKIMTTLLTIEAGDLDDYFEVDSEAIRVEGSSMGLYEGASVTRRMLLYGMMLPSGNDAANAAAVSVAGDCNKFVDMMNAKAQELGLENTHFVTPSGLDDYTNDHYSTAHDMAMLAARAMENPVFRDVCSTRSICLKYGDGKDCWLSNSNRLLDSCEGVIGVKTGFTDKAGRCLVSACERDGVTLICVTLNDPNDWYDHNRLYDYGYSLIANRTLEGVSLKVPCVGGIDEFLPAGSEDIMLPLFEDDLKNVERRITMQRFIYLPAQSGHAVGKVTYYLDGKVIAQRDIVLE